MQREFAHRLAAALVGGVLACSDVGPQPPDTTVLAGVYNLRQLDSAPWPYCASVTADEVACYQADLRLTADGRFTARRLHTHTFVNLGLELRDTTVWEGAFDLLPSCDALIAAPAEPNGHGVRHARGLTFTSDSATAERHVWEYAASDSSTVC